MTAIVFGSWRVTSSLRSQRSFHTSSDEESRARQPVFKASCSVAVTSVTFLFHYYHLFLDVTTFQWAQPEGCQRKDTLQILVMSLCMAWWVWVLGWTLAFLCEIDLAPSGKELAISLALGNVLWIQNLSCKAAHRQHHQKMTTTDSWAAAVVTPSLEHSSDVN